MKKKHSNEEEAYVGYGGDYDSSLENDYRDTGTSTYGTFTVDTQEEEIKAKERKDKKNAIIEENKEKMKEVESFIKKNGKEEINEFFVGALPILEKKSTQEQINQNEPLYNKFKEKFEGIMKSLNSEDKNTKDNAKETIKKLLTNGKKLIEVKWGRPQRVALFSKINDIYEDDEKKEFISDIIKESHITSETEQIKRILKKAKLDIVIDIKQQQKEKKENNTAESIPKENNTEEEAVELKKVGFSEDLEVKKIFFSSKLGDKYQGFKKLNRLQSIITVCRNLLPGAKRPTNESVKQEFKESIEYTKEDRTEKVIEPIKADINALFKMGFNYEEIKSLIPLEQGELGSAFFSVLEVKEAGYSARQILEEKKRLRQEENLEGAFSVKELKEAGFDNDKIKEKSGLTYSQLEKGGIVITPRSAMIGGRANAAAAVKIQKVIRGNAARNRLKGVKKATQGHIEDAKERKFNLKKVKKSSSTNPTNPDPKPGI